MWKDGRTSNCCGRIGAKTAAIVSIKWEPRSMKRWSGDHIKRISGRTSTIQIALAPKIISNAGLSAPPRRQWHCLCASKLNKNYLIGLRSCLLDWRVHFLPLGIFSSFNSKYVGILKGVQRWRISTSIQLIQIGRTIVTYWRIYWVSANRQRFWPQIVNPACLK